VLPNIPQPIVSRAIHIIVRVTFDSSRANYLNGTDITLKYAIFGKPESRLPLFRAAVPLQRPAINLIMLACDSMLIVFPDGIVRL